MKRQLEYFDEPRLMFGYDQLAEDPRDGLTLFGPYEKFGSYSLQIGVVATSGGLAAYQSFIQRLQRPIISPSNKQVQRPSFPGYEAVFGVELPNTPTITCEVSQETLQETLDLPSLDERTFRTVRLFLEPIIRVQDEEEAKVDIWFIIVPNSVRRLCRPLAQDKRGTVSRKDAKRFRSGHIPLFPEIQEEYEEALEFYESDSDFHDQLKARLIQENVIAPSQIILESKLEFTDERGKEYADEMKAHLAWTLSTTLYYKLGKLPWKLHDIRQGVCYLGLVFKQFEFLGGKRHACSAAQMFLDTGDGTVFRGNVGPWYSPDKSEFHLDKENARSLLSKALQSYYRRQNDFPKEVFIHGRIQFSRDEWDGFLEAVGQTDGNTALIGVTIKRESGKLKIFRDVIGEVSNYGNLRGLGYVIDNWEGFLWTSGYIPRLKTANHQEVSNPLRIKISKGRADMRQIMRDILALTKLNYNACIYGDGIPVTLRFSDEIGDVLTAIEGIDREVLPFKYYI